MVLDEFLNEFVYGLSVDWIDTIILRQVFYWESGEEALHLEECLNLDGTLRFCCRLCLKGCN